jgi:formylglycine-generating enzyme required for sulfatase activity
LLLVSADSIASDYFYDKEVADALERHRAGTARVVPLILRPCVWRTTPLGELQALPQNGKPVTEWVNRDAAYTDAVEALWQMIGQMEADRNENEAATRRAREAAEAERQAEARREQEAARRQAEAAAQQQRQEKEQQDRRERERREAYLYQIRAAEKHLARRRWNQAAEAARSALAILPGDREATRLLEQAEAGSREPAPPSSPYVKWAGIGVGVLLGALLVIKGVGGGLSSAGKSMDDSAGVHISTPTAIQKLETDLVPVTGGTFTMGWQSGRDGSGDDDEKPAHQVSVRNFSIGRYEVTQAQWRAVMGGDPPELHNKGCDQCPVERVSWNDIQDFLKKLNSLTGKQYRLPTEAEWEYAARGGAQSRGYLYSGGNDLDAVAWYDGNAKSGNTNGAQKTTRPVGGKKANELGLYDMSGNVWEWCADDWHSNYVAAPTDGRAWVDSPRGAYRVNRGGSWNLNAGLCRVSSRFHSTPGDGNVYLGFRLAASPSR